jgi:hypothetical protein
MPIPLRSDFDGAALRRLARQSKDGPQARRLLALAAVYEGATRTEAARIGGVTLQIVRDWVIKFNAQGPDGLYAVFSGHGFEGLRGGVGPRQQLIEAALWVTVHDAGDDVGEIAVGLNTIELAGLDQRGDHRPVLRTAI